MKKINVLESNSKLEGMVDDQFYFIPLLNEENRLLPIEKFRGPIRKFLEYVNTHKNITFVVGRLGCGNSFKGTKSYNDFDVAPFFNNAPENVILPSGWRTFYQDYSNNKKYE